MGGRRPAGARGWLGGTGSVRTARPSGPSARLGAAGSLRPSDASHAEQRHPRRRPRRRPGAAETREPRTADEVGRRVRRAAGGRATACRGLASARRHGRRALRGGRRRGRRPPAAAVRAPRVSPDERAAAPRPAPRRLVGVGARPGAGRVVHAPTRSLLLLLIGRGRGARRGGLPRRPARGPRRSGSTCGFGRVHRRDAGGLPDRARRRLRPGDACCSTCPRSRCPTGRAGSSLLGPVTAARRCCAALYDGLRLATIVICVGAANSLANPKRLLRSVPPALYEVGTALVVAVTVLPAAGRERAPGAAPPRAARGRRQPRSGGCTASSSRCSRTRSTAR